MISKLIEYGLMALAAVVALWWFNDRIEAHYQAPLIAKHEAALKAQKEANSKAVTVVQAKKIKGETVYIDRIKEIKIYAETLPKDAACLADAEFVRLHRTASR
jgi:hypothetical protein